MNEEKKHTDRDLVLAQRAAFVAGGHKGYHCGLVNLQRYAQAAYPMPTITRPRLVEDPHCAGKHWAWWDGQLMWTAFGRGGEIPAATMSESMYTGLTPERVRLWADLVTTPTETVEEGTP